MPAAWALALLSSVLGADLRVDGGVRTESRYRTNDTEGAERLTTAEVSVIPRIGIELTGPDGALGAQYLPTLRAPDVLTSLEPDVLHVAELRGRLRLAPVWTLTTVAGGERGRTDLLAESRRRPTTPEAIPTTAVLRYASARVELAVEGTLDPRTSLRLTAGGFAGGGDDQASRLIMPIERRVQAGAGVEWSATRRDTLALQLSGLGAEVANRRDAALGSLTVGWRRALERNVEARIRAGALGSWSAAPGEHTHRALLPTGEVGVTHTSERHHTSEDLSVRLGAAVDRITGAVEQQVEATASSRWAPVPGWSFGARLGAARGRQGPARSDRGAFELRADWAISAQLTAALGLYGSWQDAAPPLPSFKEGGAFLSLALDLPRHGR